MKSPPSDLSPGTMQTSTKRTSPLSTPHKVSVLGVCSSRNTSHGNRRDRRGGSAPFQKLC